MLRTMILGGIVGGSIMNFYTTFCDEYAWCGYFTATGITILLGISLGFIELINKNRIRMI